MRGCVGVRWVASAAATLLLTSTQVSAQSGPPQAGQTGQRPGLNRAFQFLPATNRRPQTDVLDLRDRHDTLPVTPLSGLQNTTSCVAGCGDGIPKVRALAPQKFGPTLAGVGPIEVAKFTVAALVSPAPSAQPDVGDLGVITCLAGCDASDRRIMQATGRPLPTLLRKPALQHQPIVPTRLMTAAAAPIVTAKAVKSPIVKTAIKAMVPAPPATAPAATPVKFKRTHTAHAERVEKRIKSTTRTTSARAISDARVTRVRKAQPAIAQAVKPSPPQIASVGIPTPIQPSQPGQKAQPVLTKPQPVVSPRRPVAVNTSSDWFKKISNDQAAKKKADDAAQ